METQTAAGLMNALDRCIDTCRVGDTGVSPPGATKLTGVPLSEKSGGGLTGGLSSSVH